MPEDKKGKFGITQCESCDIAEESQCYFCYDDDIRRINDHIAEAKKESEALANSKKEAKERMEAEEKKDTEDKKAKENMEAKERMEAVEKKDTEDKAKEDELNEQEEMERIANNKPGDLGEKGPDLQKRVAMLYRSELWTSMFEFENEIKAIIKLVFAPVSGSPRRVRSWPFPGLWVNPLDVGTGFPYVCSYWSNGIDPAFHAAEGLYMAAGTFRAFAFYQVQTKVSEKWLRQCNCSWICFP
jgi:hypothetical protein